MHLKGLRTPLLRGPADRRWWHVELGDDAASWTMDVRGDEITSVRFLRGPYPFPSFPGREVLTVEFLGPGGESALGCFVHDLHEGQRMRPGKLQAWQALRERYGNESRADRADSCPPPPEPRLAVSARPSGGRARPGSASPTPARTCPAAARRG